MQVKQVKVNNSKNIKATLKLEVDGFRVHIVGGSYNSKGKGNFANVGKMSMHAVPTREARTLSVYLCSDGRLYLGQKVSGRPAALPVKPLVDKLLWFTVEPGAKNLSKTNLFVKDYVSVEIDKADLAPAEPPPEPEPRVDGTIEQTSVDGIDDGEPVALYSEDELDEMDDDELRELVQAHGRKFTNPQRIVDYLLTLTDEDALPDNGGGDDVDTDDDADAEDAEDGEDGEEEDE